MSRRVWTSYPTQGQDWSRRMWPSLWRVMGAFKNIAFIVVTFLSYEQSSCFNQAILIRPRKKGSVEIGSQGLS